MNALAARYKAIEAQAAAEHARLCAAPEADRPAIEAALLDHYTAMETVGLDMLDELLGPGGSGHPAA